MTRKFDVGDSLPLGSKLYRKKTVVPMVQMFEEFICTNREGENLKGQVGDFLVEDGHGGFYPVSEEFHAKNYEEVKE